MSHLPFMQFYPADWIKDTRRLNPATKGHWIDLLCAMWDSPTRGEVTWQISTYARHLGVSVETAADTLAELLDTGTADGEFIGDHEKGCPAECPSDHRGDSEDVSSGVFLGFPTNCQMKVRLRNRRMWNDEQTRERNRKDQEKHRQKNSRSDNSKGGVSETSALIYQKSEVRSQKSEYKESGHAPSVDSKKSESSDVIKSTIQPPSSTHVTASPRPQRLDPHIESIADKIYLTDRKKFGRLIVWIKEAQKYKYSDESIAESLRLFEPHAGAVKDWYPYLDKIIRKVDAVSNARATERESGFYKMELTKLAGEFAALVKGRP